MGKLCLLTSWAMRLLIIAVASDAFVATLMTSEASVATLMVSSLTSA